MVCQILGQLSGVNLPKIYTLGRHIDKDQFYLRKIRSSACLVSIADRTPAVNRSDAPDQSDTTSGCRQPVQYDRDNQTYFLIICEPSSSLVSTDVIGFHQSLIWHAACQCSLCSLSSLRCLPTIVDVWDIAMLWQRPSTSEPAQARVYERGLFIPFPFPTAMGLMWPITVIE